MCWSLLVGGIAVAEEVTRIPSMEDLIVNPQQYSGSLISVSGYLASRPGFELFMSQEHAKDRDHSAAVDVENPDFRESAVSVYCAGHTAIVEGRFVKRPIGPPDNIYSYGISEVQRIQVLENGKFRECFSLVE